MKTWATISLFVSLALAQSSSYNVATPTASADSLIPTGLSNGCQTFINAFNTDSSLTACTRSLTEATKNFGPGGSENSSSTTAQITSAISNICTGSVSSACPDSLMRGKLADFYSACSAELTSNPNQQIRDLYDVLYILTPFQQAICSKDDGGNYCVVATSSTSSTDTNTALASQNHVDFDKVQETLSYTPEGSNSISPREDNDIVLANMTTFRTNNIVFLFRNENWDSSALCTTCTRNILTSYFNYESDALYAPGLPNSQLLGGQDTLVGAIQQKCGANFLNGAVQAAGGIKSGSLTSGAVGSVSDRLAGVFAAAAGGLIVAIAFL